MYLDYYHFDETPFVVTPNSAHFFRSPSHDAALKALGYGIAARKGFMMLTGEVGVGKTTTIRTFLNSLDEGIESSLVLNPLVSIQELLRTINADFNMPVAKGSSVRDELERLNYYLLDRYRQGRNAVLIIDEAQNLSCQAMEMIRLLSNLETETAKLLQILLVGQPELLTKLDSPELRQLKQRIQIHQVLKPFEPEQTSDYIKHCLARASRGSALVTFEKAAIRRVHRLASGIPRLINKVCDYALLAAYVQDTHVITDKIVCMGWAEIGTLVGEPSKRHLRIWPFLKEAH